MTAAADWSGRVGEVWAEEWVRTERALAGLETSLEAGILAAAPAAGRFLDIGCGVGTTSLATARARPDARVLGVDLSPGMIAIARDRAADTPNASFAQADVLNFLSSPSLLGEGDRSAKPSGGGVNEHSGPYDLLFSRHGVMFFPDPHAAFTRLRAAAAAPGAPVVFTCFAAVADNPWATLLTEAPAHSSSYVPGPFAFADEAVTADLLRATGWRDAQGRRVEFDYVAGEGGDPVAEALALFTRIGPAASRLRDADPEDRPALLARLADRIAPYRRGDAVAFPASAWLWSARA